MEDICVVCKKSAEVSCCCDTTLRFCYKDFFIVHKNIEGTHLHIDLETMKTYKKLFFTFENLNKVKSQIISKSKQLIHIIHFIATKKLSIVEKHIEACVQASKSKDFDFEEIFKEYENIHLQETDSASFKKLTNKNFSIFKDNNEIIDPEIEKFLNEKKIKDDNGSLLNSTKVNNEIVHTEELFEETKLKSFTFSKRLTEMKEQLELNFNLFLEGHFEKVTSIAVTSDNKYAVSGSLDKTIRIWNLLEKTQEFLLQGHSGGVTSVSLTSDNKFVVSGSNDSTIRI